MEVLNNFQFLKIGCVKQEKLFKKLDFTEIASLKIIRQFFFRNPPVTEKYLSKLLFRVIHLDFGQKITLN